MVTYFNSFNLMNIMNKIFKYSLGILTTCIGLLSLCNAGFLGDSANSGFSVNSSEGYKLVQGQSGYIKCLMKSNNYSLRDSLDGSTQNQTLNNNRLYCYYGDFYLATSSSSNSTANIYTIDVSDLQSNGSCPTCPTCEEQYTSLECQTEYNLIPIENVTANYCHVNFGLIDPMDCPIGEGTGAVQWSALYINQQQYASNDNIYITIPQDIGRSIDYTDDDADIDIEGYNADQEYIESIISYENLTPTNQDFEKLMIGLAEFLPYVLFTLLMIFFIKLVNSVWK